MGQYVTHLLFQKHWCNLWIPTTGEPLACDVHDLEHYRNTTSYATVLIAPFIWTFVFVFFFLKILGTSLSLGVGCRSDSLWSTTHCFKNASRKNRAPPTSCLQSQTGRRPLSLQGLRYYKCSCPVLNAHFHASGWSLETSMKYKGRVPWSPNQNHLTWMQDIPRKTVYDGSFSLLCNKSLLHDVCSSTGQTVLVLRPLDQHPPIRLHRYFCLITHNLWRELVPAGKWLNHCRHPSSHLHNAAGEGDSGQSEPIPSPGGFLMFLNVHMHSDTGVISSTSESPSAGKCPVSHLWLIVMPQTDFHLRNP